MDRPELREKIYQLVLSQAEDRCYIQGGDYPCPEYAGKEENDCTYCVTDQILALIPDIEEVRKQERVRIVDKVTGIMQNHKWNCSQQMAVILDYLKKLKGKK